MTCNSGIIYSIFGRVNLNNPQDVAELRKLIDVVSGDTPRLARFTTGSDFEDQCLRYLFPENRMILHMKNQNVDFMTMGGIGADAQYSAQNIYLMGGDAPTSKSSSKEEDSEYWRIGRGSHAVARAALAPPSPYMAIPPPLKSYEQQQRADATPMWADTGLQRADVKKDRGVLILDPSDSAARMAAPPRERRKKPPSLVSALTAPTEENLSDVMKILYQLENPDLFKKEQEKSNLIRELHRFYNEAQITGRSTLKFGNPTIGEINLWNRKDRTKMANMLREDYVPRAAFGEAESIDLGGGKNKQSKRTRKTLNKQRNSNKKSKKKIIKKSPKYSKRKSIKKKSFKKSSKRNTLKKSKRKSKRKSKK